MIAVFSWFLYDIGAAFSFIENHPEKSEMIDSWLTGYQKIRKLTPDDILMIPCFIMLRKMVLLGWISSHGATLLASQQSGKFYRASLPTCRRVFNININDILIFLC